MEAISVFACTKRPDTIFESSTTPARRPLQRRTAAYLQASVGTPCTSHGAYAKAIWNLTKKDAARMMHATLPMECKA